ncbi:HopJ type III effector protein-domain-containing protein [Pavlovales sp. CCMP2436]|nr:HopJ type III effector protein-domain-containing protein [Pavlovales sp. CCMP2436]
MLAVVLAALSFSGAAPLRNGGSISAVGRSAVQRSVVIALRRDAQGYIIPDDLQFDLRSGVSKALGASALKQIPPPIAALLVKVRTQPGSVMFAETLEAIDQAFEFFGTKFVNGAVSSTSSENEGSSKVLSLSQLVGMTTDETLVCFGEHYRDVVADPSGSSHANVRALMTTGLEAVLFSNGPSLTLRKGAWEGSKYSSDQGIDESSTIQGEGEWDIDSDVWIP